MRTSRDGKSYDTTYPRQITERCPRCGLPRLMGSDSKFRCENCRTTEDFFQDGDSVEMQT
jgi:uncharacterized protein (DUF983 family)